VGEVASSNLVVPTNISFILNLIDGCMQSMRIELHIQFLLIDPIFSYLIDFIKIAFFVSYPATTSITAQLRSNRTSVGGVTGSHIPVGRDDADVVRGAAHMKVIGDLLFVEEAVVATAHRSSLLLRRGILRRPLRHPVRTR
jgi:hypothetical protein